MIKWHTRIGYDEEQGILALVVNTAKRGLRGKDRKLEDICKRST